MWVQRPWRLREPSLHPRGEQCALSTAPSLQPHRHVTPNTVPTASSVGVDYRKLPAVNHFRVFLLWFDCLFLLKKKSANIAFWFTNQCLSIWNIYRYSLKMIPSLYILQCTRTSFSFPLVSNLNNFLRTFCLLIVFTKYEFEDCKIKSMGFSTPALSPR